GDSGFSGDVIFYVDNIKINPIPTSLYISQFTNATSADSWVWQSWSQPGASAWVSSPDAGGATPPGSLQLSCNFNNVPNNYQQVVFQHNMDMDPNRFTYLDLDIKLDPSSSTMVNGSTYGSFETILNVNGSWSWNSLNPINLTASDLNWTHL